MSIVSSLNEPLSIKESFFPADEKSHWINEIIGILIVEQAELLTKIETGAFPKEALEVVLMKLIDKKGPYTGRGSLIHEIMDHMFGYGVLQPYLENPLITDLIGTHYDAFYVKEKGESYEIPVRFPNEKTFENFCKLIVIRNGGILNENDCHARVADEQLKLRINAVIPPRSANGAFLSIRKHRSKAYDLEDLQAMGMMDESVRLLIEKIAKGNERFLICGKGAAGKTTLLRAMINAIGRSQRILICEADTEIYPESPTAVVQRVIKRGPYGKPVALNDLIKDGLTMSLDGYCIGEITGAESWDFVKAGYTDHRVMGTIHSNGAEEAILRILSLCEIANLGIGEAVVREMICQSIDYIIYLKGFKVHTVDYFSGKNQLRHIQNIYTIKTETLI